VSLSSCCEGLLSMDVSGLPAATDVGVLRIVCAPQPPCGLCEELYFKCLPGVRAVDDSNAQSLVRSCAQQWLWSHPRWLLVAAVYSLRGLQLQAAVPVVMRGNHCAQPSAWAQQSSTDSPYGAGPSMAVHSDLAPAGNAIWPARRHAQVRGRRSAILHASCHRFCLVILLACERRAGRAQR
jgi:hypothetical protein